MHVYVCTRVRVCEANLHTRVRTPNTLRTKQPRVEARETQRESVNLEHASALSIETDHGRGGEREKERERERGRASERVRERASERKGEREMQQMPSNVHTYIYICVCVCVYTYTHTHINMHVHTHTHTHTHIRTHTHSHTHVCTTQWEREVQARICLRPHTMVPAARTRRQLFEAPHVKARHA